MIIKQPPDWWEFSSTAWQILSESLSQESSVVSSDLGAIDNWKKIHTGITNFSYCLSCCEKRFFVQFIDPEKLIQLPQQKFFPICQTLSTYQKLQPWLAKCFIDTAELRVFEWLDATTSHNKLFDESSILRQLCHFLAVLHDGIGTLPMLDIQRHLNHLYELAVKNNPNEKKAFSLIYEKSLLSAKKFTPTKICHNDLSPGNILLNDKLFVVDWEYACIGDPLFDIAGLSFNFGLTLEQENNLFQAYNNLTGGFFHKEKFYEMKVLYELVCQLWLAGNNN